MIEFKDGSADIKQGYVDLSRYGEFESHIHKDSKSFDFWYEGKLINDNVDMKSIESILDRFVNNLSHGNMRKNISFLRTIFKDFNEEKLVAWNDSDRARECVSYYNGNLSSYSYVKDDFSLDYNYGKYSILDNDDHDLNVRVENVLNNIHNLKHVDGVDLNRDTKQLAELYNKFYGEDIDFSDPFCNVKCQTLLSILEHYGIDIYSSYFDDNLCDFSLRKNVDFPYSWGLTEFINNNFPLGVVKGEFNYYGEYQTKRISIISKILKDAYKEDLLKGLKYFSKTYHAMKYNLADGCDNLGISNYIDIPCDEVAKSRQLIHTVDKCIKRIG